MGRFITELNVQDVGSGYYKLLSPLIYESKNVGLIIVPAGFKTNFASVRRVPLVYMIFGGRGNKEATIHDWLYTPPHAAIPGSDIRIDRTTADRVFRGARYVCDRVAMEEYEQVGIVSVLKNVWAYIGAWCMWVAVRLFGWRHWG